jgi:hypothetical protein
VKVGARGFSAVYTLELEGVRKSYTLMHRYEEEVNVKGLEEVARLASIVPAVNYTLFADEIRFEFPLHELDLEFFETVADATARDIFVNRIVNRTGLIRDEYVPDPEEVGPEDAKPRAQVSVPETFTGTSIEHEGGPGVQHRDVVGRPGQPALVRAARRARPARLPLLPQRVGQALARGAQRVPVVRAQRPRD